jgi:GAF domain-containing protein
MLVAPVPVGVRTTGVISAAHDQVGWFSEGDRRLVDTLTRQAGIAIERATALELLQEVGNQIISTQEVGEILHRIVSGAIELTNTTTGVIYLISEDGQTATRKFHPPGFVHPEPRLHKKDELTRQVIASGEVLTISDIHNDPRVNPVLRDHFQSMIGVPLKIERKVIGVLYLNDENSHDFTETEISLLLTLATQAAIAIENARLLEERKQRVKELEDLYDSLETLSYVATSLIGASTYAELSSKALDIVSRRLNADAALYVRQDDEPKMMKLENCVPESFKARLEDPCRYGKAPLKPGIPVQKDLILSMDARSREGRLEGCVFVQRIGSLEQPAEPFTVFDKRTLFLLAMAVGHTLQSLRKDRVFQLLPKV